MTINELKNSIGREFDYCGEHYKTTDVYRRGRHKGGVYVAEVVNTKTGYVYWVARDIYAEIVKDGE